MMYRSHRAISRFNDVSLGIVQIVTEHDVSIGKGHIGSVT